MTAKEVTIGRDTLVALAAIAWADGKIAPAEAAGMRSTAKQLGLADADMHAVEESLKRKVDLSEVETVRMDRLSRLFTYSVASWMAQLDGGSIRPAEQEALDLLGDRLGLSKVARERAVAAASAIGKMSGTDPTTYDLVKLKSRLSVSLSQVGDE